MKTKVKICGIRTIEGAQTAMINGADFLGFNFVRDSHRHISSEQARKIIETLSTNVKIVGVFRDEKIDEIKKIIAYLKLDFVQLHGSEGKEYSALTQYAGVIKTISVPSDFNSEKTLEIMENYDVDYFLFDREKQGKGLPLTLTKLIPIASKYKIFLAGGLTEENVSDAIRVVHPFSVDVTSGVETEGKHDSEKIKLFINAAKSVTIS